MSKKIVTRACEVTWKGGGRFPYTTNIPAGLSVKPCGDASGQYFLDDLGMFRNSPFELHDATYYGLRLNADQVQELES